MKANYEINAGDISVIRPMVYCREALMTSFAKEANLPIINENCPACFEEVSEAYLYSNRLCILSSFYYIPIYKNSLILFSCNAIQYIAKRTR